MQQIIDLFTKIPVWLLLSLSAGSVIIGDLMGKFWSVNSRPLFYVIALICYFLSGVFYIPSLMREGLVITSVIWSILSIAGFLFIGLVVFNESLTPLQITGVVLGVIALILLSH